MAALNFENLLGVVVIAALAPLLLGLIPRLLLPALVLELLAGIAVGPSVLGWLEADEAVGVLSTLGLATLLLLAGMELDTRSLRGSMLRTAGGSFALALGCGLIVGLGLQVAGVVGDGLFVGIVLSSTALGVVAPVLADANWIRTPLGQLVIAAASIADVGAIVALAAAFSVEGRGAGEQLLVLFAFGCAVVALGALISLARRTSALPRVVAALRDNTAQLLVRLIVVLLVGLVAMAEYFGLELVLGAFIAGLLISALEGPARDERLRTKLDAIGQGFLVPVFFIAAGLTLDLDALFESVASLVKVPILVAALLLVRLAPMLLLRRSLTHREALAAALLLATSLPFILAAATIGLRLGALDAATAAAFVTAGLVSVVLLPLTALLLLGPAIQSSRTPAR